MIPGTAQGLPAIEEDLNPIVSSVACPKQLPARLGLAVGLKTYQAYRQLMDSARWQHLANAGACVQRLLWASTGTKDPDAPDTM